jgi:hypothetical protein
VAADEGRCELYHAVETAWLRREDSNLRIGEAKSGDIVNDINAYSEQGAKSICGYINRLGSISE